MFQNPFSSEGRIRRLEYGLSYLIYIAVLMVVMLIIEMTDSLKSALGNVILLFTYIPLIWFLLSQGAKRCHDRGNSGWWQLIPFYSLWMFFADGDIGPNEYGENPKGLIYDFEPEEEQEKES